jgi:hypothetical protein
MLTLRLIFSALFVILSTDLHAQESSSVTVMLQRNLPVSTPVVLRRASQQPYDLILVRDFTVPTATLNGAIHALRMLRARDGIKPLRSGRFLPTIVSVTSDTVMENAIQRTLTLLSNAPERSIAGIGMGRTIEMTLPWTGDRFAHRGESVIQAAQRKQP